MKIIERIIILKKHKYNDFRVVLDKTAFLSREMLMSYLATTFQFNITEIKENIINFTKLNNESNENEFLFFSNKANYTEGLYSLEVIDVYHTDKKFHTYHKPKQGYKRKVAEDKSKVFKDNTFWKPVLTLKDKVSIGLARNKKTLKFFLYNGSPIDPDKFDFYDIKLQCRDTKISVTSDFIFNKCSLTTLRSLKNKGFIENVDFVIKYFEANDERYADIKM